MQYPTKSEYVKSSQDASDNLDMSTKATDEELNEAIIDEYGVKYSKDGRKLLKSPRELDGTYFIKKETRIICDDAFRDCSSLRSLVILDSVTSIGDNAFCGCTSLHNLVIPVGVSSIGDGAFRCCRSFRSLVIPESVTIIGDSEFMYCYSLCNLAISNGVTSIGDRAFRGCDCVSMVLCP